MREVMLITQHATFCLSFTNSPIFSMMKNCLTAVHMAPTRPISEDTTRSFLFLAPGSKLTSDPLHSASSTELLVQGHRHPRCRIRIEPPIIIQALSSKHIPLGYSLILMHESRSGTSLPILPMLIYLASQLLNTTPCCKKSLYRPVFIALGILVPPEATRASLQGMTGHLTTIRSPRMCYPPFLQ